jgi:phytoene/squalene synthetase
VASDGVRRLIAFEADRCRALLNSGTSLLAQLHGWARLAVTGYVAGGGAALLALRRVGWDVLPGTPRARKLDVLKQLAALARGRRAAW